MFPIMSTFAPQDEDYVRRVVPQFVRFGNVLQVQQCSAARVETSSPLQSYFYKKSCVAVLQQISPRNSDDKWRVTLNSFLNEHTFLEDGEMLNQMQQCNVRVPTVLGIERSTPEGQCDFSTVFRTVLEYLAPPAYREERRYNLADSKAMLQWLAGFHAFFWDREGNDRFLECGGWWRLALRPTVKFDNILATVQHLTTQFPVEFASVYSGKDEIWLEMSRIKKLDGFRLALGAECKTLIHGDCKSSNFFFNTDNNNAVTGIDFQWVGGAVSGAADVVYLLFGSCERIWERENELKQAYLDSFCKQQQQGVLLTREEFDRQYDLELLDYFTTVCPYLLADLTRKKMEKNLKKYGYLTYEEDIQALAYFFKRTVNAYEHVRDELQETKKKSKVDVAE